MVVIAKENMELYRHDGVGIFKSVSGIEVEFKTEELVTIFKNNGVSITVKTNLEIVYFIDIYFNLVKEIYHLYKKPNDDPLYINKKSNDPLSILQQLSNSISEEFHKFHQINVFLNNQFP